MAQPATVLIADDHTLYREGLREIIDHWEDFTVVCEAKNGKEAVDCCRQSHPDLVLMDLKMPVMDGLSALMVIHREMPDVIVVMLSVYEGENDVIPALQAGARGYILKNCYARQLHHKLRCIMDGACALSEESALRCVEFIQKAKPVRALESPAERKTQDMLTDHERQLLALIAIGASNKEIGDRLYISESTVKKQISFLLAKLNLENRVQAAVFALRAGIAD